MIVESLVAGALVPAVVDFLKGAGGAVSRKFFGVSVDDQIKLSNADVTRLEALAKLDNPHGAPSQWVVDLRASFRYIGAILIILIGCGVLYAGVQQDEASILEIGYALVGIPFSFIFGERLLLGLKGPGAK